MILFPTINLCTILLGCLANTIRDNEKSQISEPEIRMLSKYSGIRYALAPIQSFYQTDRDWSTLHDSPNTLRRIIHGHLEYLSRLRDTIMKFTSDTEELLLNEADLEPKLLRIGQNLITKVEWISARIKELENELSISHSTDSHAIQDIRNKIDFIISEKEGQTRK
jgi:hypothetical protein